MAVKIGDLCFPNGQYLKDGEQKTRWMKCGVLLETEKGMRVKLDAIPVVTGENGLWLSVFTDRPKAAPTPPPAEKPAQAALGDEDTPF